MTIRDRLTWLFLGMVAVIMLAALSVSFILQERYTHEEFHRRLRDRAEVTGYIFLERDEMRANAFREFERRYLQTLPNEVLQVYNSQLQPRFLEEDERIQLSEHLLARIVSEREVFFDIGPRQAVGVFYHDNQGDYVIVAAAENSFGKARLRYLAGIMVAVFVGSLVLIYVAGRLFAGRALRPIADINDQVDRITARDLHLRLDEGKTEEPDEISRLARTFNRMLERLEDSFESQGTFVRNASHELRTPLTSTIGELQVLMARERDAPAYREALGSVLAELLQFRLLVNNLLELAQTDSVDLPKTEEIRLDELVWEVRNGLPTEQRRRVQVQLGALPDDAERLVVRGSRALLLRALSNLVENALKYSPAEQPVELRLDYEAPHTLRLRVLDRGIGIADKDYARLFQPFFRGDNSRHVVGHGVGLPLARNIIGRHGGQLALRARHGGGTMAEVVFDHPDA
ncbi:HAMP domain-containing protein [Hymenobacter sp. 15J16-1T3B]|uniref:sensor histidine kinase n=1 Tax=Hymenobacter sp. 15J16-1T3B TaxID=2886941 RepID=UPI001D106233|nr:ATP-binding protein [Hymenobacter sp. 15J16-1T3B]MCC3159339.1 HAMP domain-containing protein [Hymenobacter sp. 15J16-1T3B]